MSKILALAAFKENPIASGDPGKYGVIPPAIDTEADASHAIHMLRLVTEDIDTVFTRQESNEVRGDAQSSGSIITDAKAGGGLNLQWSLGTYDDLLVGLLYAHDDAGENRDDGWQQEGFAGMAPIIVTPGSAVTWNKSTNKFSGSFSRAPIAGEKVFVRGFGNRNLDTIWEVADSPAPSAGEWTPVNDTGATDVSEYAGITADVTAPVDAVTMHSVQGYTRNGTFERSFGLVKFFSDASLAGMGDSVEGLGAVDWSVFRGQIVSAFQLSGSPGQAGFTGSLTFMGKDEVPITDALVPKQGFSATNWNRFVAPSASPLVNTLQNVLVVRLKNLTTGAYLRVDPLSLTISIANKAVEVGALRNLGAVAIQLGTYEAKVGMALMYVGPQFHSAMLVDQPFEIEVGLGDSDGKAQLWRLPKTRLSSKRPNPGKNKVVEETLEFTSEAGGNGMEVSPTDHTLTQSIADTLGRQIELLRFYALT